jgi:hypothetical protein
MHGQSDYVYSKQMNQGSLGISGSYGFSGLAKVNGSLSAYVGKSSAESGKSMKVSYQGLACAGLERVDLNNLTAPALLANLAGSPRSMLLKAMVGYCELREWLKTNNKELLDVLGKAKEIKKTRKGSVCFRPG